MTKPTLQAVDPNTTIVPAPDPFDLASLRLNPSFLETAGVKKLLLQKPVSLMTLRTTLNRLLKSHETPTPSPHALVG
jgi:hypothetical protein